MLTFEPAQGVCDNGDHVGPFRHEIHTGNSADCIRKKITSWKQSARGCTQQIRPGATPPGTAASSPQTGIHAVAGTRLRQHHTPSALNCSAIVGYRTSLSVNGDLD